MNQSLSSSQKEITDTFILFQLQIQSEIRNISRNIIFSFDCNIEIVTYDLTSTPRL